MPIVRLFVRAGVACALVTSIGVATAAAQGANGYRVRTVGDTIPGGVGGVAVDRLGIIYVADFGDKVFRVTPDGRIDVFATGLYGSSGNAVDSKGNLLQSNFSGNYVSRIDRTGNVSLFADGIRGPVGIAIDPDDNLVVTSCPGNALHAVTTDGAVTPFAESDLFNCPNGITRHTDGTYYVVNFSDTKLLAVTPDGVVSHLADLPGGGNGHITIARGALYATSFQGNRVYRVTTDGEVTLVAGTGAFGEQDGPALEALFTFPNGIAAGPNGDRVYVNDFINRFPPTLEAPPAPKSLVRQITFPSITAVLAAALRAGGIDSMTNAYQAWKTDPGTASLFTEREVNALGYQLMTSGALPAATKVFELNVASYPNSWNVYDSLAEAHLNAGRHDLAIRFYERSLQINPANTNATQKLAELRK